MSDLARFIAVYDDVLSPDFCRSIIDNFHECAALQQRNGAGVREGLEDSSWTELNITALADAAFRLFFEQTVQIYFERYNRELALSRPLSPVQKTSDLMMKWYRAEHQDRFQIHFDSIRAVSNRYLVFLWYLNDVQEGGETYFPDIGVSVTARAGRLLIFPPYWMFQHAGMPPRSGDKYIISSYALY
jgi:prolyl 4-hydroxylase